MARRNHTWTEEPEKDIWRQIRYLSSSKNVCRLLTGEIDSDRVLKFENNAETEIRATQISACVNQASEYHAAFCGVGLTTSPLLQFYSMQALAKACVLANVEGSSLRNLKYHGLSTRPTVAKGGEKALSEYSADENRWSIEEEYAVVNQGVYSGLCAALGIDIPAVGTVLKFGDIAQSVPDLHSMCSRHYNKPVRCFYLNGEPKISDDGHFEVFFSGKTDLESLLDIFPEFEEGYEEVERHGTARGYRSMEPVESIPDFIYVEAGTIAGSYLVRGLECGIRNPNILLFSGLFILSNVVRYKPEFWMREIVGQRSGSVSVVEAFSALARRRMPNALLEAIWGEEFTYGSPGYMT